MESDGGERTTVRRQEPFSAQELKELYCETDYRQQIVSIRGKSRSTNSRKQAQTQSAPCKVRYTVQETLHCCQWRKDEGRLLGEM